MGHGRVGGCGTTRKSIFGDLLTLDSRSGDSSAPSNSSVGYAGLIPLVGGLYLPLAFFARLPLAMLTIGSMTLVTATTGSYALGGLSAAMVGIGSAVGGPTIGYLADRLGQRPVLLIAAILNTALLAGMAFFETTFTEPNVAVLVLLGLLTGASVPQVGPMSRVRWISLTRTKGSNPRVLSAALGIESMLDELGFVLGPVTVGLLASLVHPVLPLVIAAVLTIALVPLFAVHPTGAAVRPATTRKGTKVPLGRARASVIALMVLGMIGLGTVFGSLAAATLAFAGAQGDSNQGGMLYGAMGLSSAIAAVSVAAWPQGFTQSARWIASGLFLTVTSFALHVASDVPWMLASLFLVGIGVGPVIVTVMSLGGEVAPAQRLSTVMTLLSAGIVVGTAIGNGLAGVFAESMGYLGAFWVATGASVVITLAAVAARLIMRSSRDLIRVR